jgi:hypothetical protein
MDKKDDGKRIIFHRLFGAGDVARKENAEEHFPSEV